MCSRLENIFIGEDLAVGDMEESLAQQALLLDEPPVVEADPVQLSTDVGNSALRDDSEEHPRKKFKGLDPRDQYQKGVAPVQRQYGILDRVLSDA